MMWFHPGSFQTTRKGTEMEQIAFVGIDVAKDTLAISIWGKEEVIEIHNRLDAIQKWLVSLPEKAHIGLESTGSYHRLVAGLCVSSGRTVHLLQPRDMSNYRRTVAPRGKTDAIDAQVIARFVAREHASLRSWTPPTPDQDRMDSLLKTRAFCSRQRSSLNQVREAKDSVEGILAEVEKAMTKAIASIDRQIKQLVKKIPEMANGCARLETIDGVGPVIAAALGNTLCKHDFKDSQALIGYIGLDPRPMESGKYKGRKRLSKRGPAELRRLLYLAAMTGVRKSWKERFETLLAKGLPRIAALCAVARKIISVAWAIWNKAGAVFDPQKVVPKQKAA